MLCVVYRAYIVTVLLKKISSSLNPNVWLRLSMEVGWESRLGQVSFVLRSRILRTRVRLELSLTYFLRHSA